jgi:hypothetical protein
VLLSLEYLVHAGSCTTAHRDFTDTVTLCVQVRRESRSSPPRSGTESKKSRIQRSSAAGPMVQHTCSCKKVRLAYPTAAASAPQPRLSSAPHIIGNLMHCSRLAAASGFCCTHHAKKGYFALSRSIEKATRRQAPIQRPRLPGTRVTHHHAESSFGGCVQSASAGPAAAVPLVRGEARLGQAAGIGGGKGKRRKLQDEICLQARKETWIVGSERSLEALRRHIGTAVNQSLLRGRPGGWKHLLAALPYPAPLARTGGCCIGTGEAGKEAATGELVCVVLTNKRNLESPLGAFSKASHRQ